MHYWVENVSLASPSLPQALTSHLSEHLLKDLGLVSVSVQCEERVLVGHHQLLDLLNLTTHLGRREGERGGCWSVTHKTQRTCSISFSPTNLMPYGPIISARDCNSSAGKAGGREGEREGGREGQGERGREGGREVGGVKDGWRNAEADKRKYRTCTRAVQN